MLTRIVKQFHNRTYLYFLHCTGTTTNWKKKSTTLLHYTLHSILYTPHAPYQCCMNSDLHWNRGRGEQNQSFFYLLFIFLLTLLSSNEKYFSFNKCVILGIVLEMLHVVVVCNVCHSGGIKSWKKFIVNVICPWDDSFTWAFIAGWVQISPGTSCLPRLIFYFTIVNPSLSWIHYLPLLLVFQWLALGCKPC